MVEYESGPKEGNLETFFRIICHPTTGCINCLTISIFEERWNLDLN